MKIRHPFSAHSTGDGKALAIKYREMVMIGILAFRGRQDGVMAHRRRAIAHGATKREGLEAVYAAQIAGGIPRSVLTYKQLWPWNKKAPSQTAEAAAGCTQTVGTGTWPWAYT